MIRRIVERLAAFPAADRLTDTGEGEMREKVAACLYGHLYLRIAYKPQHGRILNWPELPEDDYHRRLCLEVADGVLSLPALATPNPPVDAGAMRSAVQAEIDRLKGADSPWAIGIRDRLTAAIRSQSDAGEPL